MKARLIIADDHPLVCQGLSELIERTSDMRVVARAHDGVEAERLARTLAADLLILDVAMPLRRGIKVLESLRADRIALPVLFFSMYPAAQYLAYVRRAGAQGFLGKESEEKAVLAALRRVLAGGTCFSGGLPPRSRQAPAHPPVSGALSKRENEVMQHLLRGTPLVSIAAELGISAQSVTTYRRRILDKLDVRNNAELIALVSRIS